MNNSTTVIHIRDAPNDWKANSDYVYIGRPSLLGIPFNIGKHGTRSQVIEKYRKYALDMLREAASSKRLDDESGRFVEELRKCYGKKLICFCAPQACHGDVLVELLETEALLQLKKT